jgi:hypothetical protein
MRCVPADVHKLCSTQIVPLNQCHQNAGYGLSKGTNIGHSGVLYARLKNVKPAEAYNITCMAVALVMNVCCARASERRALLSVARSWELATLHDT